MTPVVPLGTSVRLRRPPVATCTLFLLNLAAWLVVPLAGSPGRVLPLLALAPAHPSLVAALVSCFLHVSFLHLAGNMVYLGLFGAPVEDRLGRGRFVALYLGLGMAALLAQSAAMRLRGPVDPLILILGSSGAISGTLGLFLVRFPRAHVFVAAPPFLLGRRPVPGVGRVNAAVAITAWLAVESLSGFLSLDARHVATAHWAHLVGFGLGVGVGCVIGLPSASRRERLLAEAADARRDGRFEQALFRLRAYTGSHTGDLDAWFEHARLAQALGQHREAQEAYAAALGIAGRSRDRAALLGAYAEMTRSYPDAPPRPTLDLLLGRRAEADGLFVEAARFYDRAAQHAGDTETAREALERAARLHLEKTNDLAAAQGPLAALAARDGVRSGPQPAPPRPAEPGPAALRPLRGLAIVPPPVARNPSARLARHVEVNPGIPTTRSVVIGAIRDKENA